MNERARAKILAEKLLETASLQGASVLEFGMACDIAAKKLESRLSLTPVQELGRFTMRAEGLEVRALFPEEHRELADEIMEFIAQRLDEAFPD